MINKKISVKSRPIVFDQLFLLAYLHACDHFRFSFNPETPILRRKGFSSLGFSSPIIVFFRIASQYGMTPEQEMKQRRTSYLIATDQRIPPNRANYLPADFSRTSKNENYSYDIRQEKQSVPPPLPAQQQQQKLR